MIAWEEDRLTAALSRENLRSFDTIASREDPPADTEREFAWVTQEEVVSPETGSHSPPTVNETIFVIYDSSYKNAQFCWEWDNCRFGKNCRFSHQGWTPPEPPEPFADPEILCRHYTNKGWCKWGDNCEYEHADGVREVQPEERQWMQTGKGPSQPQATGKKKNRRSQASKDKRAPESEDRRWTTRKIVDLEATRRKGKCDCDPWTVHREDCTYAATGGVWTNVNDYLTPVLLERDVTAMWEHLKIATAMTKTEMAAWELNQDEESRRLEDDASVEQMAQDMIPETGSPEEVDLALDVKRHTGDAYLNTHTLDYKCFFGGKEERHRFVKANRYRNKDGTARIAVLDLMKEVSSAGPLLECTEEFKDFLRNDNEALRWALRRAKHLWRDKRLKKLLVYKRTGQVAEAILDTMQAEIRSRAGYHVNFYDCTLNEFYMEVFLKYCTPEFQEELMEWVSNGP